MSVNKPREKRPRMSSGDNTEQTMLGGQECHVVNLDTTGVLQQIIADISVLKEGQNNIRQVFKDEITILKNEIKEEINQVIDKKISVLSQHVNKELKQFNDRIHNVEKRVQDLNTWSAQAEIVNNPLKDTERCIMSSGIPFQPDENRELKVSRLMDILIPHMNTNVEIVAVERLNQRGPTHNPLVKVAFATKEQKIAVLRAKQNLSRSQEFPKVRMWSSKPHVERVQEINFRTILSTIPEAKNRFHIAGNGKIVLRDAQDDHSSKMDSNEQTRPHQYHQSKNQEYTGPQIRDTSPQATRYQQPSASQVNTDQNSVLSHQQLQTSLMYPPPTTEVQQLWAHQYILPKPNLQHVTHQRMTQVQNQQQYPDARQKIPSQQPIQNEQSTPDYKDLYQFHLLHELNLISHKVKVTYRS